MAKAKGEIYTGLPENGIAIMNADNNDWLNWQSIIGDRRVALFAECGKQRLYCREYPRYVTRYRIYPANADGQH